MTTFRLLLTIFVAVLITATAHAYVTEYEVTGRFLVEMSHAKTGKKTLELWQVRFLRGTVPRQPPITDFEVLRISLLGSDGPGYSIRDVSSEHFQDGLDSVMQNDNEFVFSIGVARKFNVKLSFAQNGALDDLSGSVTSGFDPTDVTIYRLLKDSKDIRIVEPYRFIDSYRFLRRQAK